MKKKIISFLTSSVMAAACLGGGLSELTSRIHLVNEPLTAEAATYGEETKYGDYLYYKTVDKDEDGTYDYVMISDCNSSAVSVEIPAEIDGLPVTSIGDRAFHDCTSLASIIIPDSVTEIGGGVFYNCTSLKDVTLSNNITSLDYCYNSDYCVQEGFFEGCTRLSSITIPDSVTSIGKYTFSGCKSLKNITIPDSVTSIGNSAFPGCTALKSITIPDSVTSIGDWAFYKCTSLESITIPDSVTSIGYAAFSSCTSLESVTIGNGITSIESHAFSGCTALKSITIPDNVTSIRDNAFYKCTSLESITIPDSVTSIEYYTFYKCISLSSITIPDSVTSIGSMAFYGCTSLKNVYVSDIASWCNIDFIGSFSNPLCYANNLYLNEELIKDIIIPDRIKSIPSYAFSCSRLESITIPDSVTSIGSSAFSGCTALKSITIPDSVTSIGYDAFYNCSRLESVTIGNSVTSIGDKAFYGCNKMSQITIPATVETIGEKALGYSSAGNVIAGFKIYCVSGTAAVTYAINNGIEYIIDINNTPYMSKTELSLNVGDTFVLEVKNFSGDIVWDSNDSSIATVKDGCVSGVSTGETIVYAIIGDSVMKCSVIVQPSGTVTTPVTTTSAATSTTVTTTSVVSTTVSSSGTTGSTTTQTTNVPVTTVSTNSKTTAVTTTVTTVPVTTTSSAPETTTSETVPVTTVNTDIFDVKENNGTIIIVNCDNLVVNVIVPETIDGKTVSKVNDFAFSSEEIESVQFENPDIEIADSATTINEDAVIYGYWDSTAHEYASKYNRTFVSLDGVPEYLPGDISGNDKIDLYDAIEICKSIMGMRTFTDAEKKIADFDGNGKVDLYDAIGIAKKLLEK